MTAQPPIVMQTLWRTRGTYFWSLFRRNPGVRAFIEPLHEALATRTRADWDAELAGGITGILRHPEIERHYFDEYPIRPEGGIEGFSAGLSFGQFILGEEEEAPELVAYLQSLVAFAAGQGQRAFFKFTRGGLRAAFIRKAIGGTQVYLNRPPAEIWASYQSYGPGNYFVSALLYIALRYRGTPFLGVTLGLMAERGELDPAAVPDDLESGLASVYRLAYGLNDNQVSVLTGAFWLAYLLHGLEVADVVIDTERLAVDPAYRARLEEEFAPLLGEHPFSDYRPGPSEASFVKYAPALASIVQSDAGLQGKLGFVDAWAGSLGDETCRVLEAVRERL